MNESHGTHGRSGERRPETHSSRKMDLVTTGEKRTEEGSPETNLPWRRSFGRDYKGRDPNPWDPGIEGPSPLRTPPSWEGSRVEWCRRFRNGTLPPLTTRPPSSAFRSGMPDRFQICNVDGVCRKTETEDVHGVEGRRTTWTLHGHPTWPSRSQ